MSEQIDKYLYFVGGVMSANSARTMGKQENDLVTTISTYLLQQRLSIH